MPRKYTGGRKAAQKRYAESNRAAINARKRARYLLCREAERARQLRYQRANKEKLYKYNAKWQRERNAKVRKEMFAAFGDRCACCGETELKFLDLDHTNNNGKEKRAEYGNAQQEILALQKKGWPREGYQIMCSNCHQGRHRNNGVCPHKANTILG